MNSHQTDETMECPQCGKIVLITCGFCPHCGFEMLDRSAIYK